MNRREAGHEVPVARGHPHILRVRHITAWKTFVRSPRAVVWCDNSLFSLVASQNLRLHFLLGLLPRWGAGWLEGEREESELLNGNKRVNSVVPETAQGLVCL